MRGHDGGRPPSWLNVHPTRSGTLTTWNDTAFEQHLAAVLTGQLGNEGSEYLALYVSARQVLLRDVLEEIRGAEPYLTDHGPKHVRHVLNNVYKLLERHLDYFDPLEHYILGLSVLFHDVGNLHGRKNHNKRIAQFYDHVRQGPEHAHEKALVVRIAQAHTGKARNGSSNTLLDVPELLHFDGARIRAREIAAIVRFADELAEGQQRTSQYMTNHQLYAPESQIHHDYSSFTSVTIDGGNERIAVTYQLKVRTDKGVDAELTQLQQSLQFALQRLAKMDLERRYARFHCAVPLVPFQRISVCLDVQVDGEFIEPSLEAVISDEVDPDSPPQLLSVQDGRWQPDAIVARVRQQLLERP